MQVAAVPIYHLYKKKDPEMQKYKRLNELLNEYKLRYPEDESALSK